MFFNEAPEHYEQSVCSRKCPNCQKYTAEIANDAAIAYFNYVFGKNHGIIYKSDLEALTASERVDLFRKKVVVA